MLLFRVHVSVTVITVNLKISCLTVVLIRLRYILTQQINKMKQIIFLITLLSLTLADKPDPIYKSPVQQTKSVKPQEKTDKIQSRQDQYGAPAADQYGSPAAPQQDSYGSPAAPAQDSYGSPQAAPVEDSYGSPKGEPVAPAPAQAQGSVGTQGYYYYYYPVASSSNTGGSGGYGGGNKNTHVSSSSGGGLGGGLIIPIVLGLGLLLLLAVGAAALFGNNGRSFFDGQSILASMAPYTDELTVGVLDAIKVYTDMNQVEQLR